MVQQISYVYYRLTSILTIQLVEITHPTLSTFASTTHSIHTFCLSLSHTISHNSLFFTLSAWRAIPLCSSLWLLAQSHDHTSQSHKSKAHPLALTSTIAQCLKRAVSLLQFSSLVYITRIKLYGFIKPMSQPKALLFFFFFSLSPKIKIWVTNINISLTHTS